ncbi:uncharacterized protein LOC119683958 [Teleopsis dalmanni]|uniref:uncharacterized protein LOC119683958 n=1 Tax=Teleopsis dalmanni TaxID=139649 RepID=UPI0018CE9EDF|nr:uncharacterized protein LOC119683958 [Teleopsis dalmanni]
MDTPRKDIPCAASGLKVCKSGMSFDIMFSSKSKRHANRPQLFSARERKTPVYGSDESAVNRKQSKGDLLCGSAKECQNQEIACGKHYGEGTSSKYGHDYRFLTLDASKSDKGKERGSAEVSDKKLGREFLSPQME